MQTCHQCPCGSGLVCSFYKDYKQEECKACNKCKPIILHKIFDEYFLDTFLNYFAELMFAKDAPLGYEYQWEDFLKEKNIKRTKTLEFNDECITIKCPENEELYILVPKDYAEKTLKIGKIE